MTKSSNLSLNSLKEAYKNRSLVPFVGAGLSIPLNVPGWGTLIDDISRMHDYELLNSNRKQLTELIDNYKYLEAVDLLVSSGIQEKDIQKSISMSIKKLKLEKEVLDVDSLYRDLAKMNCTKYLTTNYDNFLSDYVGNPPSKIEILKEEYINELNQSLYDSAVYNLHGDYRSPSSIVLSRESYNNLYKEQDDFSSVFEHFRERYTFLFLGTSFDDEYLQNVLKVSKGKLRAKHYLLTSNMSEEKRIELENKYDLRIIKYEVKDNDHTTGIREILSEISHVDIDELDKSVPNGTPVFSTGVVSPLSMPKAPLLGSTETIIKTDTKLYEELESIKILQEDGELNEATEAYNKIIRRNIINPIPNPEFILIIKRLLYNNVILRDYEAAKDLIDFAMEFSISSENVDLLFYIIDYYFNIGNYESAYNISVRWHKEIPNDISILGLKVYTETVYKNLPLDSAINVLIDNGIEVLTDNLDEQVEQFIYRLIGELGIKAKDYSLAIDYLQKAYRIDDNVFNMEDLGLAYYFKALENSDDTNMIRIVDIQFGQLNKAIEFFENALIQAKGDVKQGVQERIAIPYLHGLFYLNKPFEFLEAFYDLKLFFNDEEYEITKMKLIMDSRIGKLNISELVSLQKEDRIILQTDYLLSKGMFDAALEKMWPMIENEELNDEGLRYQLLLIYFNKWDKENFNIFYKKYQNRWNNEQLVPILESYYLEINGENNHAEDKIKEIINQNPISINFTLLVEFYSRTKQEDKKEEVYKEILENHADGLHNNPENFYFVYLEHLIGRNQLSKAYSLLKKALQDIELSQSDSMKIILIEVKMRLWDFTDVVQVSTEIYEKYKDYGEAIFSYYAAVASMHYLDFEDARLYINIFKENGEISAQNIQLINRVESKLDAIQSANKSSSMTNGSPIGWHAYYSKLNSKSILFDNCDSIILDAPSLYVLIKENLKSRIEKYETIYLTFSSMSQILTEYVEFRDEVLADIIFYLQKNRKVKIVSPSIDSLLKRGIRDYEGFRDHKDCLLLLSELDASYISSYHIPFIKPDGTPLDFPFCIKTFKIQDGELQVKCDPNEAVL